MTLAVGTPPTHRLAIACLDGGLTALAFTAGHHWLGEALRHPALVAVLMGCSTPLVMALTGAYTVLARPRLGDWLAKAATGLGLAVAGLVGATWLAGAAGGLPRSPLLGGLGLALAAIICSRLLYMYWRHYRAAARDLVEPVLLVGPTPACGRVMAHLRDHPWLGLAPVGVVCQGEAGPMRAESLPVYPAEHLGVAVSELHPRRVLVCGGPDDHELLRAVMEQLANQPVAVQFIPDLTLWPIFCLRADELAGMPALTVAASPLDDRHLLLKEVEDRVLGTILLLGFGPLLLAIAAAVRLTSPGPALFVQPRHGLHGRLIRVYKFRTMRQGGGGSGTGTGSHFRQATTNDPRVTPLGRLLRKTSLDELPQLINVVKGEMSLVGPRPHPLALNERFRGEIAELMRRHLMKPGITGLAQIKGARGETRTVEDMRRRVQYDLEYIRSWSLWLDLRILARTALRGWINREP